jgi:hypothetical protein
MAKKVLVRKTTKKKASKKGTKKHTHRVGASPANPGGTSIEALLGKVNNKTKAKGGNKKSGKPVIVLDGRASELLKLQVAKMQAKSLEGTIAALESALFDDIEKKRIAINCNKQEYVGSINVRGTGEDEKGATVDAGMALYYRQNRFSAFNYFDSSGDDTLQAAYEGKATLRDEAINAIATALTDKEAGVEVSYEDAEAILDERMQVSHALSIDEGVLACNPDGTPVHPEIIAILQKYLSDHLCSVTKVKPTEAFYKRSNWDLRERSIMLALQDIGLCKQAKATFRTA